jgi:hypothetical protein
MLLLSCGSHTGGRLEREREVEVQEERRASGSSVVCAPPPLGASLYRGGEQAYPPPRNLGAAKVGPGGRWPALGRPTNPRTLGRTHQALSNKGAPSALMGFPKGPIKVG